MPQFDLFVWPVLHLWEFPKPVIAQVHGYAIGGGTYFALLPDITIVSEDAYFQMPLVQGLGLPGGETMIEPWVFMNWKRASEYLYTAQTLSANEALQMGLVNRVVPRDELEAHGPPDAPADVQRHGLAHGRSFRCQDHQRRHGLDPDTPPAVGGPTTGR